ncbi:flagellar assembly protein FliH [Myxococcota bacterium]|nr:flagellar assembly protein FliH [Myxococcota bacterium]
MSSFKPDPGYGDLVFRPVAFGAHALESFARSAAMRPSPAAPVSAPVATATPACTPAEHAELEAAAFEKGRASAEADRSRCEQACLVFEAAAAELARVSAQILHANREQMIGLAGELARLWIGEELRLDPTRFANPLERALAQCGDESEATLRFHPTVLAALEASLPEQLARWSDSLAIALVADPTLAPVDFRIESGPRTIESDLDGLARRLREAVGDAFEVQSGEGGACR